MFDFLISRIKDYIPVSDAETKLVESLFVQEHFKKNEVLLPEGSVCQQLFFVAKGIVRFSQLSDGEERTYVFRAEGALCRIKRKLLGKTL